MHSLLIWGEYETREGTAENARLFFFFRVPCFIFATSLLFESLAVRPQEKRRDKGTVRFHYKKLSLFPVLFMLLKFISFSMFFRLTFCFVVSGRL